MSATSELPLHLPHFGSRRGPRCGRNVDAGPGSCWHYWDLCPAKVADCYTRELAAIAAKHGVQPRQPIPAAMQADVDAMHERRRKAVAA